MLHKHISLIICLLLSLMTQAKGTTRWLESEHDFGTIHEEDGKVSCVMRLLNDSDSSLIIMSVRTSCGCTATDYDRKPIAPGDTASIRITYNPFNRPGQFEKNIFVYTNGHPRRTSVSIRGNVIAKPETLDERYPVAAGTLRMSGANIPLGELKRNRTRSSYITTYNASTTDTLIVSLQNVPPHIKAAAAPDTLSPGMTGAVTVNVDAAQSPFWGLNTDTLTIMSEPISRSEIAVAGMTHIYVMAQILDDFTALTPKQRQNAPHISLSTDKLVFTPEQTTATLTVTNTGHDTLELRRLWTAAPGIKIACKRTRLKHGKNTNVTISVDPTDMRQPVLNTRMTIISNDPDQQTTAVRLVGDFKQ